jgi:hypothetical protein
MRNIGANEPRKSALALTMKDQEVTILINDLAADYDMFRGCALPGPTTDHVTT